MFADDYSNLWTRLFDMGGTIVATAMFLMYMYKKEDRVETLVHDITLRQEALQRAWAESQKSQTELFIRSTSEQFGTLKALIEDQNGVTRENIKVVSELRGSLSELVRHMEK